MEQVATKFIANPNGAVFSNDKRFNIEVGSCEVAIARRFINDFERNFLSGSDN